MSCCQGLSWIGIFTYLYIPSGIVNCSHQVTMRLKTFNFVYKQTRMCPPPSCSCHCCVMINQRAAERMLLWPLKHDICQHTFWRQKSMACVRENSLYTHARARTHTHIVYASMVVRCQLSLTFCLQCCYPHFILVVWFRQPRSEDALLPVWS